MLDLFVDIDITCETDSRYDKMLIPLCRKGIGYSEKDDQHFLTIRYWTFSIFQWWGFKKILTNICDKLIELKIIGCGIDNDKFIELITVLKIHNIITSLDLSENHITSLNSIEYLTNLQELSFAFNDKIEDITSISKLYNLQSLNFRVNLIQHLEPLRNLENLRQLDLSINQITDISPLWKLQKLKKLSLYANYQLQFIGQLSGLTQLEVLNVAQCDIRSPKYIERLKYYLPYCHINY